MDVKREELYNVPVPVATDSYSPVSHRNIIESVYENLDKRKMSITGEQFNASRDGRQVIGYMDIGSTVNQELGMRIAFRNSYDKTMTLAFVAGSVVWICGNGMIAGDIQYVRKHTGAVATEVQNKIEHTFGQLESHFDLANQHSDKMKTIDIDRTAAAELCGKLFMDQELITSTQLNIIKRELKEPSFKAFTEPNLWSLYNHTTYSLKSSHPSHYIDQHVDFHQFIEAEFAL